MSTYSDRLKALFQHKEKAQLHLWTLGKFEAKSKGRMITGQSWGRDKTIQLFQFLITNRKRNGIRKEQIVDQLWEEANDMEGDRNFRVAMHGLNKVLEPDRPPRTEPLFVIRDGLSYRMNNTEIWIDLDEIESLVNIGHEARYIDKDQAILAFKTALELHQGVFLPNRIYEDWTSIERERIQVIILGAYFALGEILLNDRPFETINLMGKVISIDPSAEDAYQLLMKAYLIHGNRPAAMKTYHRCVKVLDEEFGLDPLPETQAIFDKII